MVIGSLVPRLAQGISRPFNTPVHADRSGKIEEAGSAKVDPSPGSTAAAVAIDSQATTIPAVTAFGTDHTVPVDIDGLDIDRSSGSAPARTEGRTATARRAGVPIHEDRAVHVGLDRAEDNQGRTTVPTRTDIPCSTTASSQPWIGGYVIRCSPIGTKGPIAPCTTMARASRAHGAIARSPAPGARSGVLDGGPQGTESSTHNSPAGVHVEIPGQVESDGPIEGENSPRLDMDIAIGVGGPQQGDAPSHVQSARSVGGGEGRGIGRTVSGRIRRTIGRRVRGTIRRRIGG